MAASSGCGSSAARPPAGRTRTHPCPPQCRTVRPHGSGPAPAGRGARRAGRPWPTRPPWPRPAPRPPAGHGRSAARQRGTGQSRRPGQSNRGAGQDVRDVGGHRGGDQDLLGVGDQAGQPVPAARVELGEHVVQDQHRVLATLPQQVEAGQPQRERERPGLAVAGVAAGGQRADGQLELVAVRADQADAAVELAGPDRGQRRQQCLLAALSVPRRSRLGGGCVLESILC